MSVVDNRHHAIQSTEPSPDAAASVHEALQQAPGEPGVYVMKDAGGQILYVGKARSLKKRLSSYRKPPGQLDIKTRVLMQKVAQVDTIVTVSEKEALILESNLIKTHRPRYNVVLKDDKRYPSLRLDPRERYPRLRIVRKIEKDGALYFGPFASAHAVRQTLKFIDKTFKLRKCKRREFASRTRPCLHCQMLRCLAPCCRDVHNDDYADIVREVTLFLRGRTPELIRKVRQDMATAAEDEAFERAAALRDKLFALERTLEQQTIVNTDFKDRDAVGLARSAHHALITLLTVRGGFLLGLHHYPFDDPASEDGELISTFIRQYYERTPAVPAELLLPMGIEDRDTVTEWLSGFRGRAVRILQPKRGEKAALLKMAVQNAEKLLAERVAAAAVSRQQLIGLQRRLRLADYPGRIECVDISNLQGRDTVASLVVFEAGAPRKRHYRRYRLPNVTGPDDYAAMAEVLKRRFTGTDAAAPLPDLLMVDGGKGQLNVALEVVRGLGLTEGIDLIGIAKADPTKGETQDKIFLPGRANPVVFGTDRDSLLLLQRIRDEAHRFAVTFHRKRRRRRTLASALDAIPGIGPRRKQALMTRFKSVKKIRAAALEDLCAVPGMTRPSAEAVIQAIGDASVEPVALDAAAPSDGGGVPE